MNRIEQPTRIRTTVDASAAADDTPAHQHARVTAATAALNADVFYVSGPITRASTDAFRRCHLRTTADRRDQKKRCLLVLTTFGGDADGAYLIARYVRREYEHFTICVFGYCESAGTLLALGAHELVMGTRAELGPLDVQVMARDELFQWESSLKTSKSLSRLIHASLVVCPRFAFT